MTSQRKRIGVTSRRSGKFISRGFSIVSAIFLLVVLSVLGAMMMNISNMQHVSSAMDVQGTRAYQAARAGIEWGLFTQLNPPAAACFASPTSFALPTGGANTLSPFTVTVTCNLTTVPATMNRWQIISTACNQPKPVGTEPRCPNWSNSPDYVQRVLQVEF